MIDDAILTFANGNSVRVERAKFKDGGWVGVYVDDEWVYYPPSAVGRVRSRSDGEEGEA